jgi:two-component system, OmpR family, sensor kinase
MPNSTSLVRRVAWGSAWAASAAALLAAVATTVLATYLVRRAEDRRVEEAAVTLAALLEQKASDLHTIKQVYEDEADEMEHTGMLFAVYDQDGRLLVGPHRLLLPAAGSCASVATGLRACSVRTDRSLYAVAGAASANFLPLLASAAIASALLAGLLALLASQPISRVVVSPLTRLRERIAQLEVDPGSRADLGPPERVAEVDALRSTIEQLLLRAERAIAQAQRFAANAAHELRTPLTSVQAELELLFESIGDGSRADALRAHSKLSELLVLVERLLVLSVPARSATDAHEVVSLRDLLEDAVEALPEPERKRVSLSASDVLMQGDATLLATMVANALSNALKFGDNARLSLRAQGSEAFLTIDDDGPGMDVAERERVFEPFFRAENALRLRVPGHGLGLALIRHIAQTHGGSAAFVDKPEPGARLEIRVPRHAPSVTES